MRERKRCNKILIDHYYYIINRVKENSNNSRRIIGIISGGNKNKSNTKLKPIKSQVQEKEELKRLKEIGEKQGIAQGKRKSNYVFNYFNRSSTETEIIEELHEISIIKWSKYSIIC